MAENNSNVNSTLNTVIQLRRGTEAQWEPVKSTFIPAAGEPCVTLDGQYAGQVRIGNGVDKLENLPYAGVGELSADEKTITINNRVLSIKGITSASVGQAPVKNAQGEFNWITPVEKEVEGTRGKAYIFNESDGGGAKFVHTDGSESFVGVNDGGQNGLMAQIYADKLVEGKWQGAKLDVTNTGMYYTVGNQTFAERAIPDNELVVKKDIKDIAGGMHFIGTVVLNAGETVLQAIERCYTEQGKVYADRKAGDIVIIKTPGNDQEYICDSNKNWIELGDQGNYATKAELAAEEEERLEADATLQSNIDTEASTRATEDAKKVDKEIVSAEGKALIFNEADGGGAKFEGVGGINSFVGVNNAGDEGGIAAQIYAVDATASGHNLGAKLDVTKDGMFYTTGAASGSRPESRDVVANELAVKRDITDAVTAEANARTAADTTLQTNIDNEAAARTAADTALETNKLNVLPKVDDPTDPGFGWEYHIPYRFDVSIDAEKANIDLHTLTLDNKVTKMTFNKQIPSASTTTAGLMSAADKVALNGKQDKLTAGNHITIENNVISAVTSPVLENDLTAEYNVGGIKSGDFFAKGTTIESILVKLLTNNIPEEDTDIYYGSSTNIPSDLTGLTKVTKNINTLINNGMIQTVLTGTTVEGQATPQYTVIACKNILDLTDWKNNPTKISYMSSVTKVTYGEFNIYYKTPKCYDADIGGEEYKFEFKEA